MKKQLLLTLCISIVATISIAQTVIRGPYLQKASDSQITIKWRTSQPTQSVVHYGSSQGNLNLIKSNSTLKTDHELELTNLNSNSIYYYDIANSNSILINGSNDLYFKTHPTIGSEGSYKFWVLGDCGTGNADQRNVRDAYYNHIGNNHTDGILFLGDNAYNSGEDLEYQNAIFENMYEDKLKNSIAWSCLGNHDGYTANSNSQTGPYFDIFSFPTNGESGGVASGTEAYYSFDYGNIHFIVLDSYGTNRAAGTTMWNWAQNDIQNTNQDWIIAFWHHPPYSKGSHNSDDPQYDLNLIDMRENFLPMLEDNGVDLVLSGHSHSYERSYYINGHYGYSGSFDPSQHIVGENGSGDGQTNGDGAYVRTSPTSNEGAVYVVAGSSGKIQTFGALDHPAMFYGVEELGSCALEVNGDKLDLKFIRENGNILDYFTITKDLANCTDNDNDGICANQDCNDNDPNFPATIGSSCNDGNSTTENDVILADGCTCQGTVIGACNVVVNVDNNTIAISGLTSDANAKIFNTSWEPQWSCNPWQGSPCDNNEIHVADNGTYYVSVQSTACDFFETISVSGGGCTDVDNDGVCANQDCDDNDPSLPTTVGSSCNDGDSLTTNDEIQSDGCTCLGTLPGGCNVDVTTGNGAITITGAIGTNTKIFNTSWDAQWSCNPWQGNPCSNLETYISGEGTFYVSAQSNECDFFEVVTVTNGGCIDSDNDGVCDIEDCSPNDPGLPATPGTACNDFDVNTTNDLILSDGCTCQGTPDNGSGCNISYTSTSNSVTLTGLTDAIVTVNLFDNSYNEIFNCGTWSTPCDISEVISNLNPGTYILDYESFDSDWNLICDANTTVQIGNIPFLIGGDGNTNLKSKNEFTKHQIVLYPNPANDLLNINLTDFLQKSITIEITNSVGQKQFIKQIDELANPIYKVDLAGFENGVYTILFNIDEVSTVSKIFVISK